MKKSILLLQVIILAVFVLSCKEDNEDGVLNTPPMETLDETSIVITIGEEVKLTYSGDDCIWQSEEPAVAIVRGDGYVTGVEVGKTKIRANNSICEVQVKNVHSIDGLMQPCIIWGKDIEYVKEYMEGCEIVDQYENTNDKWIEFEDSNKNIYTYTFDKISGKLTLAKVSYAEAENAGALSFRDILDFVYNNYTSLNVSEDLTACFENNSKSTFIILNYALDYNYISYMPN